MKVNFSHVWHSDPGPNDKLTLAFCPKCGGQVFSCCDPVCEDDNESAHHCEPMVDPKCPFAFDIKMAVERPLTDEEMAEYKKYKAEVEERHRQRYGDIHA